MPPIASLQCSRCSQHASPVAPQTVCPHCSGALYVRYDMATLRATAQRPSGTPASPEERPLDHSMWRYRAILPTVAPVTLGEGWTPLLRSRRYPNLWIKEEAANPTGSLHARGMSLAVSMARHHGLKKLAFASTGNAASALAAYAAAAGCEAHICMPRDVPFANYLECTAYGAQVTLVDGDLSDCAQLVAERTGAEGWFDISSLQEPFRLEGAKTMGYELVEQLGWEYPDAIFYPAGRAGMAALWKAFEEMEQLGWLPSGAKRPKMIAVQCSGVAPLARAFECEQELPTDHEDAASSGGSLPRDIVGQSGGLQAEYAEETILRSLLNWAAQEGLLLSPAGAAATASYDALLASGYLSPQDKVVLFNTGAALKHADLIAQQMRLHRPGDEPRLPPRMPVGGIITPQ